MKKLIGTTLIALAALTSVAKADIITKTVSVAIWACQSDDTFMKIVKFYQSDKVAYQKLLLQEMLNHTCKVLAVGDEVRIDKRSFGMVCTNDKGSIDDCFWTLEKAVE